LLFSLSFTLAIYSAVLPKAMRLSLGQVKCSGFSFYGGIGLKSIGTIEPAPNLALNPDGFAAWVWRDEVPGPASALLERIRAERATREPVQKKRVRKTKEAA